MVHWDQAIGVTDLNLSKESPTGVRKREVIAMDTVVDAVSGMV